MMQRKCLAVGLILAGLFAVAWTPPALFAGDEKSSNSPVAATPPVAKKVRTENRINGGNLVDDYRWLREKPNPEVAQYLEAENAYTDAVMKPTEALQKKLYDEMVSHIKETDVNVPYKDGDYFYYSRWEAGKQYQIYARKKGSLEAAEQLTVDVNELAKGEKFMALGAYTISDDGNLLAYSTDNTGFRQYRLHLRDLRTGKDLPDTVEKTIATNSERTPRTTTWSMRKKTSASTSALAGPAAASTSCWNRAATQPPKSATSMRQLPRASGS